MSLNPRPDCLARIREVIADDPFTTRAALLRALELSDLEVVNEVLSYVDGLAEGPRYSSEGLLARLREERWG